MLVSNKVREKITGQFGSAAIGALLLFLSSATFTLLIMRIITNAYA